jgi:hypothetical protein
MKKKDKVGSKQVYFKDARPFYLTNPKKIN